MSEQLIILKNEFTLPTSIRALSHRLDGISVSVVENVQPFLDELKKPNRMAQSAVLTFENSILTISQQVEKLGDEDQEFNIDYLTRELDFTHKEYVGILVKLYRDLQQSEVFNESKVMEEHILNILPQFSDFDFNAFIENNSNLKNSKAQDLLDNTAPSTWANVLRIHELNADYMLSAYDEHFRELLKSSYEHGLDIESSIAGCQDYIAGEIDAHLRNEINIKFVPTPALNTILRPNARIVANNFAFGKHRVTPFIKGLRQLAEEVRAEYDQYLSEQ